MKELKVGDFIWWWTNDFWNNKHGGHIVKETKTMYVIKPTNDSVHERFGLVKRAKASVSDT